MNSVLPLPRAALRLPAFLPDATRAVVRTVDSADLEACGVEALVMSTFHLMQHPGSSTIQAYGGLHAMTGWRKPIVTDSGGFQVYSLIRQNPRLGSLTERGATFRLADQSRRINLTPEKSIQLQLSYGADVVVCLDDCTHAEETEAVQADSVRRTILWAKRSKAQYLRLVEQKQLPADRRPLIFAVIQGGASLPLRKQCAEALLEIGFDGFGFGGWPLDSGGHLLVDILGYTRELVPANLPMHALGVAHPENIRQCTALGYDLFDGAMPTRDARHGRLYTLTPQGFDYVYVTDARHIKARQPVSPECDCLACTRYSLGYLHHLFQVGDSLALRLATMHNLRFMTRWMARLQEVRHG